MSDLIGGGSPAPPTFVQLPDAPCVVIYNGSGDAIVVTDWTCQAVDEWARFNGPIARPIMVARLRAIATLIDAVDAHA